MSLMHFYHALEVNFLSLSQLCLMKLPLTVSYVVCSFTYPNHTVIFCNAKPHLVSHASCRLGKSHAGHFNVWLTSLRISKKDLEWSVPGPGCPVITLFQRTDYEGTKLCLKTKLEVKAIINVQTV